MLHTRQMGPSRFTTQPFGHFYTLNGARIRSPLERARSRTYTAQLRSQTFALA